MPRLILGTFDSFFARVVGLYPLEFGFPTEFSPMEDHEVEQARRATVARILQEAPDRLLQCVTDATVGKAESGPVWTMATTAENSHSLLLAGWEDQLWGDPSAIWDDPTSIPPVLDQAAREAVTNQILGAIDIDPWFEPKRQKCADKLSQLLGHFVLHEPGSTIPKAFDTLLKNLRGAATDLRAGSPDSAFNVEANKWTPDPTIHNALVAIIDHIHGCAIQTLLLRASGTRDLLACYEEAYQPSVRLAGTGDFTDVRNLLAGQIAAYHDDSHQPLSLRAGDGSLPIDTRLPNRPVHWLLDEFQDTSYPQWSVIEPLVRDSLDPDLGSGDLFYVGDMKQSVFGWRGGDSRLFGDVFEQLNQARPDSVLDEPMDSSWRSGPALIETVNRVFGTQAAQNLSILFPSNAGVPRWVGIWQNHTSQHPNREDFVRLDHVETRDDRAGAVLDILNEVQPHLRGMSCAIICRTNGAAAEIADHLRAHGDLPVMLDAEVKAGADNPVATLFLSLLTLAQHPDDQRAAGHLRISPLASRIWPQGYPDPKSRAEGDPYPPCPGDTPIIRDIADILQDQGFGGAFKTYLRWLTDAGVQLDPFSLARADELRRACAAYADQANRSVDTFRSFLVHHTGRDPAPRGVIQILTIHRAKGLGFDLVLLPDLEGNRIDSSGFDDSLWAKQDRQRKNQWVIARPDKATQESVPALKEHADLLAADALFENLCVLYVALTRAKFGTYAITTAPTTDASLKSLRGILAAPLLEGKEGRLGPPQNAEPGFGTVYQAGSSTWFELFTSNTVSPASHPDSPIPPSESPIPTRRFPARKSTSPSSIVSREASAWQIFNANAWRAAGHGTIVHNLLEQIGFLDDLPSIELAAFQESWADILAPLETEAADKASSEVLAALQADQVATALTRPALDPAANETTIDLWRERRFEVVLAETDQFISGIFDRVTIHRDSQGHATRATITDFKTNAVRHHTDITKASSHYQPQLETYRQVLAQMLSLDESQIRCDLLFTVPAEVREG